MTYMLKVIEVLAESDKSWEDAAANAIARARKTIKGIKSHQGALGQGRKQQNRTIPD